MANEEHVAILKEGVDVWNKWRLDNPDIIPDLGGVDLHGIRFCRADLCEANLFKTNLSFVDFRGTTLKNAYLNGVNLSRANLCDVSFNGASLTGAILVEADLSRADLSDTKLRSASLKGANFREANLRKANLRRANLSRTNLYRADLGGANLGGVNLRESNLYGANLRGANLSEAKLRSASLKGANLIVVDLRMADLTRADLESAILLETAFGNTNLTDAKGLDSCRHFGPSILDHRTLQKSGNLPLNFLRGCGLPDTYIEYIPSILGKAIEFYSCFISYSHKDEEFAKRLHADLQDKGIRCWFAPEDMKIGDRLHRSIDEAIRVHDKLILILSENSVTRAWVRKEVETALEKEKAQNSDVLFPIRLDDAVFKTEKQWAYDIQEERHIGDFTKWKEHDDYTKAFERLVRDLSVGPTNSNTKPAK